MDNYIDENYRLLYVSPTVNAASIEDNVVDDNIVYGCADDPNIPDLEEISRFSDAEDDGAEADMTNLDTHIPVSPILTTRIHKDHTVEQIIGDIHSAPHTRRMTKSVTEHAMFNGCQECFSYGKIEEEVYVCQPPGFEDPDFPNRVYKVEKVLYGLHQAPRAWYETLSTYLLDNRFQRGKIDKTLFIRKDKGDILLVQVYVDDIIFGSTKKSLCTEFEKIMHKKFQMSSMGELTFFLGLQIKQKEDGIFISQDEHVTEILKKFSFIDVKTTSTPMETQKPLLKDEDGEEVDVHLYRSMIGSLMYFTSLRPDIMFAVYACARYQVNPKVSHLDAVKRIFRYLKGQPKMGIWYPKDSPFDLVAYTDSDYAGASLDRKSTIEGCQFFGYRLISWQCKKQTMVANSTTEAEYVAASSCCRQVKIVNGEVQLQALVDGKKIIVTEAFVRRDLQLNDEEGTNCLPNATIFKELTRMGYEKLSQKLTFYKAFFSPQWKFLIHTILQCLSAKTTTWNEFSSTMASAIICLATNQKFNFSKYIFENIVKNLENVSDKFLMYPSGPTTNVADKAVYKEMDDSLMRATTTASSLEAEQDSGRYGDEEMFDTGVLDGDEVLAEPKVTVKDVNLSVDEVTLAQALAALKSAKVQEKANVVEEPSESITTTPTLTTTTAATTIATVSTRPKAKGLVIHEEEQATTPTFSSQQPSQVKAHDKGKGIMVEEPVKIKKKDQISLDEELAFKLQTEEEEEEERLARVKPQREEEANIVSWDNVQAMIDADYQMAQQMQAEEQEKLSIEEKSKLEDLETLWKLVKAKHGSTRPEEGYERVLWGDLKTMFDPHVKDQYGGDHQYTEYWIRTYMIQWSTFH
ncbi:putative ribonuclease H-like domain-containing protein [Tanacetum coccineum]